VHVTSYTMQELTPRQKAVLQFIGDFIVDNSFPPTTREIAQHFGFKSQTAAVNHLRALEFKGRVSWQSGKSRTIRILKP
jgi:repressor LexA